MFRQSFSCSALLDFTRPLISYTGLSPCIVEFSNSFYYEQPGLRAAPRSLAATKGISVDFFSPGT